MKQENYKKGKFGENIALKFLIDKDFELVEQNYQNKLGEIDLIMRDREWLVFVEVKYKSDDWQGTPEEMINKGKLYQVRRVAESYIYLKKPKEKKYRIDAVCILNEKIKHYENI